VRRVDLLNDVDPGSGWIVHGESALTPGLIMKRIRDLQATALQALELSSGIVDLKGEE
jgi:hypothetical protein